ncbi:DNA helicase UvrD [Vreelandella zhaodongensis]|uniref:DNA helicase UvrD n=1 Tax=Vreelandella zhaodongensis TaxID=1176240 RepID=A0ABX2SS19_VREZH|nr:DNA helicase UvrD [Halomonas zhaodongensis]NYS44912.1 DNA helicase UvrD [Halomonas zhaodongensis]
MDKRVVLAVAGSGKTSHIIDNISEDSRALIVTYTENNYKNIKSRIIDKVGFIPLGVRVKTYFNFIYSFCFKPLLGNKINSKGINWDIPPAFTLKLNRSNPKFYLDSRGRLYHNRIAKLLDQCNMMKEVSERVEKYFDLVCFDEVQDFGGHDFNFICKLSPKIESLLLVGDFFQHTFDTSRDGNVNSNIHKNIDTYTRKLTQAGYTLDTDLLSHSYRCSPTTCSFVYQNTGIQIESHRDDETIIQFVQSTTLAEKIYYDENIVKLFFRDSKRYNGFTENWGATKGLDCFLDVCIVLNATTLQHYKKSKLHELAPQTKNKFYVACTRAKRNIFFVSESLYKHHKQ